MAEPEAALKIKFMTRKSSRERTDIFFNSKKRSIKPSSQTIIVAGFAILIILFLLYQFGYFIGQSAFDKGF